LRLRAPPQFRLEFRLQAPLRLEFAPTIPHSPPRRQKRLEFRLQAAPQDSSGSRLQAPPHVRSEPSLQAPPQDGLDLRPHAASHLVLALPLPRRPPYRQFRSEPRLQAPPRSELMIPRYSSESRLQAPPRLLQTIPRNSL